MEFFCSKQLTACFMGVILFCPTKQWTCPLLPPSGVDAVDYWINVSYFFTPRCQQMDTCGWWDSSCPSYPRPSWQGFLRLASLVHELLKGLFLFFQFPKLWVLSSTVWVFPSSVWIAHEAIHAYISSPWSLFLKCYGISEFKLLTGIRIMEQPVSTQMGNNMCVCGRKGLLRDRGHLV